MSKPAETGLFDDPAPAVRRAFVGWDLPPIRLFVEWILNQAPAPAPPDPASAHALDLSSLTLVVPTVADIRPLLLELANAADRTSRSLYPPAVLAESQLPQLLAPTTRPAAGRALRILTWISAAQDLSAPDRAALGLRDSPASLQVMLPTANRFDRLVERLASARQSPLPSLADPLARAPIPAHDSRSAFWSAFDSLLQVYIIELAAAGFDDGRIAARPALAQTPTPPPGTLVLLGLPYCSPVAREALSRLASPVFSLVAAPEAHASRFDDFGTPLGDWSSLELPLADNQIRFATNPADQALLTIEWAAAHRSMLPRDLGVTTDDPEAVAALAAESESRGIPIAQPHAGAFGASRIYRLLAAIEMFARDRTFENWARLCRHPDLMAWLTRRPDCIGGSPSNWLAAVDCYAEAHLPRELPSTWAARNPADAAILNWLALALSELFPPEVDRTPAAFRDHARQIVGTLEAIYATVPADADLAAQAELIRSAVQELSALPDKCRRLTFSESLRFLLWMSRSQVIAAPPDPDSIQVTSSPSLAFSHRPSIAVLSANEGAFFCDPDRDPDLPDSLLSALGLPTRESTRAARAFALHNASHSRRSLLVIACRQTVAGDPLLPISELFACADDALLDRVRRWSVEPPPRPAAAALAQPLGGRALPRVPHAPVTSMSVTDFGAFLKCPYHYYLTRVLKLKDLSIREPELGPPKFGNFMHEALRRFAADDTARDESSPEKIARFLSSAIDQIAAEWFAHGSPLPFPVQAAQAKSRLRVFARWQAARRAEGWRIAAAEWKPTAPVVLNVGDKPMPLTGRIDRIDLHPDLGYAVFDYKTGANASTPKAVHLKRDGTWLDLQLPLYRILGAELVGRATPTMGYINLAGDPAEIGEHLASFSPDELDDADRAATDVIRRIRAGDFFDLGPAPPDDGVFAAIIRGLAIPADAESSEDSP